MANQFSSHVLLVDGAYTLRRSIHQPNLRELSTSRGVPSGGVYGFLSSVKSAVNNLQCNSVVVCWEGGHSQRRMELYPDYKSDRVADPNEERDQFGMTNFEYYLHQLDWIKKILEMAGIPQIQIKGKEGDDVIFQVSRLLRGQKTIISEDRDFFTIINEDTNVFRPIKKEYVNYSNFRQYSGYETPKHFLYAKSMLGDSDNIPGIAKGVGEGTVKDVLNRIPTEEELTPERIIQEAATFNKSRYNKIVEAGTATIYRNLDLIDMSLETFNTVELIEVAKGLQNKLYPNKTMMKKILLALEFNPDNAEYLVNRLSSMSDFPLANILDTDFIQRKMADQTSVLQG